MAKQLIRIGTRGSRLALFQSNLVKDALLKAHSDIDVELIEIKTSGDWSKGMAETRLSAEQGGKGLFCKEIEKALLDNHIDIGVHSLKDMPAFLPKGLTINTYLKREDPRDVFVSKKYRTIDELPEGAVIGTSSVRRQSFLLNKRPDIKIVPFRGNVPTRLDKIEDEHVDGTFLAYAGLNRLGLMENRFQTLEIDEFLPACGQGIICIEQREGDPELASRLDALNHKDTALAAIAERALLETLDGSCRTPIGGFAELNGNNLTLTAQIGAEDGSHIWQEEGSISVLSEEKATDLGKQLGIKLKSQAPSDLFLEHYECG